MMKKKKKMWWRVSELSEMGIDRPAAIDKGSDHLGVGEMKVGVGDAVHQRRTEAKGDRKVQDAL